MDKNTSMMVIKHRDAYQHLAGCVRSSALDREGQMEVVSPGCRIDSKVTRKRRPG